MTTTQVEYFLNSKSSVVNLETVQISHPSFTQDYFCVRNYVEGMTAKLENGADQFFTYYPMKITQLGVSNDLDQSIHVELGDLGEILPKELDAVSSADTFHIKPTVKYRTYRSDDLTAPMFGPINLEVNDFAFTRDGSAFDAKAPSLNINTTGVIYRIDKFPMLRGFL